jgi:hypothetical protein
MENDKKIILVTGGSGLVGRAIRDIVQDSKNENEEYVFSFNLYKFLLCHLNFQKNGLF